MGIAIFIPAPGTSSTSCTTYGNGSTGDLCVSGIVCVCSCSAQYCQVLVNPGSTLCMNLHTFRALKLINRGTITGKGGGAGGAGGHRGFGNCQPVQGTRGCCGQTKFCVVGGNGGGGGGGGGAGGGPFGCVNRAAVGGCGGNGGTGGGIVAFNAKCVCNNCGTICVKGTNATSGGCGTDGQSPGQAGGGGGGGGAGGGGGSGLIKYCTFSGCTHISANGGSAGAGGNSGYGDPAGACGPTTCTGLSGQNGGMGVGTAGGSGGTGGSPPCGQGTFGTAGENGFEGQSGGGGGGGGAGSYIPVSCTAKSSGGGGVGGCGSAGLNGGVGLTRVPAMTTTVGGGFTFIYSIF